MKSRIYLRALELDDYKTIIKWRNDSEIQNLVGGHKYFVSQEKERQWVENVINNPEKLVLAICLKSNNKHIGNIILQNIDWINRSAEMPIMLGDKSEWNKGYGTEARMMLLKFAFEERGLERICDTVLEENISSLKMHEKCGYKIEGLMRNSVYKNGKFQNQYILAVLKDDFYKAYEEYSKKFGK